jgi:uncharacterized membrane protein
MTKNIRIKKMILTSILIALCFIATFINIPLPSPTGGGLMHLGGVILFLSAIYLGPYIGGLTGAIGMTMFDLFYFPIWAPCTVITRFIMGYVTGLLTKNNKSPFNVVIAMIIGSIIMIAGYYLYGVLLADNWIVPLADALKDGVASVATIIVVIALLPLFKRIMLKFDKD